MQDKMTQESTENCDASLLVAVKLFWSSTAKLIL